MKSKCILFVYLILSVQIFSQQPQTVEPSHLKKMFSGIIEFPGKTDCNPCLFYKGEKLFTERHGPMPWIEYSFYDISETHSIFIVITKDLSCSTQTANTLATLKTNPSQDYICYKLQAKRNTIEDDSTILTWDIFDHKLVDNIIPLNSLIFLFDPQLIAGLKLQSWKAENIFRVIPTILIKPDATSQEIERALTIAQLSSLDIKSVHREHQANEGSIITPIPKNI